MNILILNGVNLNMIGKREEVYGTNTYKDLEEEINKLPYNIEMIQTNSETEYIELIQQCKADYLIVNPGAWTHYSYAIRDALTGRGVGFVEVHLTDIEKREEFRKKSVIEDVALKTIMGKGFDSYIEAIEYLVNK